MPTLGDIIKTLHAWIPPETAQSYDNVGLQVGNPNAEISSGLVALDLTPQVVEEAVEMGADLIVTHHPLLFKGLKTIDASDFIGGMLHRLISNGIAVIAAHTNLDSASDGVSAKLAKLVGIVDPQFLKPVPTDLFKLVTHVPEGEADEIRAVLTKAADWTIGPYGDCAFELDGHGYFRPLDGADPYVGETDGEIQKTSERKIELTVPARNLSATIAELERVHPYETIAYDVYRLEAETAAASHGLGMIGELEVPTSVASFVQRVARNLGQPAIRYAGDPNAHVSRVAVCGGAGRDLIETALRSGADAYVTADLSYHNFFDVLDADGLPTMALIDAGHYETEAATEDLLVGWLSAAIADVDWAKTRTQTSPIRYLAQ